MEPIDLRPAGGVEIFVADDLLKTARALQEHLATISYDQQPEMAVEAMEILGDPRELYGSKKIFVHALGARVLHGGSVSISFDEELWHGTYLGDAYLKAQFSRFSYIRTRALSGICLNVVEATILRSQSNPEFEGEKITSGVYIPVHAAETVLAA